MPVPRLGGLLEPGADLCRALRMLAIERAPLQDALDGLGHVQPAAAERRVERHDPVLAKPDHHLGRLVSGKVVPDEEHAQRRQFGRQGEALRQAVLPGLPCGAADAGIVARITSSRSLSQPCRIGLVQLLTGWRCTCPVAG